MSQQQRQQLHDALERLWQESQSETTAETELPPEPSTSLRSFLLAAEPSETTDRAILRAARDALSTVSTPEETDLSWWQTLLQSTSFRPAFSFAMVLLIVGAVYLLQAPMQKAAFQAYEQKPMAPSPHAPMERAALRRTTEPINLRKTGSKDRSNRSFATPVLRKKKGAVLQEGESPKTPQKLAKARPAQKLSTASPTRRIRNKQRFQRRHQTSLTRRHQRRPKNEPKHTSSFDKVADQQKTQTNHGEKQKRGLWAPPPPPATKNKPIYDSLRSSKSRKTSAQTKTFFPQPTPSKFDAKNERNQAQPSPQDIPQREETKRISPPRPAPAAAAPFAAPQPSTPSIQPIQRTKAEPPPPPTKLMARRFPTPSARRQRPSSGAYRRKYKRAQTQSTDHDGSHKRHSQLQAQAAQAYRRGEWSQAARLYHRLLQTTHSSRKQRLIHLRLAKIYRKKRLWKRARYHQQKAKQKP